MGFIGKKDLEFINNVILPILRIDNIELMPICLHKCSETTEIK